MIVDQKTDKLDPCRCGFKPDHYSIAYGSTPYSVFCPNCDKQACEVGGPSKDIISFWNDVVSNYKKEKFDGQRITPNHFLDVGQRFKANSCYGARKNDICFILGERTDKGYLAVNVDVMYPNNFRISTSCWFRYF